MLKNVRTHGALDLLLGGQRENTMKRCSLSNIVVFVFIRRALFVLVILVFQMGSAFGLPIEYNGSAITTKFHETGGFPDSATTNFFNGLRVTSEHELLHAIGFAETYTLFRQRIDDKRNFKDSQSNLLAILTPKEQGTHVDPTKTVNGFKQSTSIMQPSPVGLEAGEFEKKILDAAFNWSGQGGLKINVNYTGEPIGDADKEWVTGIVNRVEGLFGPAGQNPKQFTWDVQRVDPPVPKPKEQPKTNSRGQSIAYDALTETLSIRDDVIVSPGGSSDPINGAEVLVPSFHFNGYLGEGLYYFFNESFADIVIDKEGEVFLRGEISALLYDAPRNYFYWTIANSKLAGASPTSNFYDPTLTSIVSPFIAELLARLDESSPMYKPDDLLYFSYQPDVNFGQATFGFTRDSSSAGGNGFFTSEPVPEPSTIALLTTGLIALILGGSLTLRSRRPAAKAAPGT